VLLMSADADPRRIPLSVGHLRGVLRRRPCGHLTEFDEVRRLGGYNGQALRGIRAIPIAAIVGTIGRCCDFDRCFNPIKPTLRRAVASVRRAFPDGAVPPVEIVKLADQYFVADGHKRISVARRTGAEFVDADVTEVFPRRAQA
jgi:hypothetical protein